LWSQDFWEFYLYYYNQGVALCVTYDRKALTVEHISASLSHQLT
jgi:hypothetical protein